MSLSVDPGKEYCKALSAFHSPEVSHLYCEAGDLITILEKYPTGWWRGQVGTKTGIFDSSKVQKLNSSEARALAEELNSGGGGAPPRRSPVVARAPPSAGASRGARPAQPRMEPVQAEEEEAAFSMNPECSYVVADETLVAHVATHMEARAGELIMVVKRFPTGWWKGVSSSGAAGIFDIKKVSEVSYEEAEEALSGGGAKPKRKRPVLYQVQAQFEYEATARNQLSFAEGEVLNVLQEAAKGWLQAETLEGVKGFIPGSYVERYEGGASAVAEEEAPAAADLGEEFPVVVAAFDYEATGENQLSFFAGDRITVYEKGDGWWSGSLENGEEGFFPESFVVEEGEELPQAEEEEVEEEQGAMIDAVESEVASETSEVRMCRALFDYSDGDPETQLQFLEGDLIEFLEEADGGWARGTLGGLEGYFPLSFVEFVGEEDDGEAERIRLEEEAAAEAELLRQQQEEEEAERARRAEEEERIRWEQEEAERIRREEEEEAERIRQEEEEAERIRWEQEEAERIRREEEEEAERIRQEEEEAERIRWEQEEAERIRREEEEAERIRWEQEEAERIRREEEEAERIRREEEEAEAERLRLEREEQERKEQERQEQERIKRAKEEEARKRRPPLKPKPQPKPRPVIKKPPLPRGITRKKSGLPLPSKLPPPAGLPPPATVGGGDAALVAALQNRVEDLEKKLAQRDMKQAALEARLQILEEGFKRATEEREANTAAIDHMYGGGEEEEGGY